MKAFTPQPYRHLAEVLRSMGWYRDARVVQVRRHQRRYSFWASNTAGVFHRRAQAHSARGSIRSTRCFPLLDLGHEEDRWRIAPGAGGFYLMGYVLFLKLFGWYASVMAVAAVTGLLRKD